MGPAPLLVRFDGAASEDSDGSLGGYAWAFGDGAVATGATAEHTYTIPGLYTATLTVTDNRGATGTASAQVQVTTPVGSGSNSIVGTVWYDRDANGSRDGSEPGLEGFRVYLDNNGNAAFDTQEVSTITAADGTYRFDGVSADSTYLVRQDLEFGWTNTASGLATVQPELLVAGKVVGGADAQPGAFGFQVALVAPSVSNNANAQFCGGTLIAASWVLTAAHCVDGTSPDQVQVLVGTQDLTRGGQRVNVRRIRIFPEYGSSQGIDNDLALLELDASFMIPRIALQRPDRPEFSAPGTLATVLGWGLTQASGTPATVLQRGDTPLLSNQVCGASYADLTAAMICTSQVGGVDACQGDSGGPLAVPDGDVWVQVGIVSFGLRCAAFPGVYARVTSLYDYVAQTVPAEASAAVPVDWTGGASSAEVEFGNFR